MVKGAEIVTKFINTLNLRNGLSISRTQISRNVFEYSNELKIFLYIKGIAQRPYKVILLFESEETGYLLTSKDTLGYINNKIWPLAKDGDYKPASGSYLANNSPLYSIEAFVNRIESINTV